MLSLWLAALGIIGGSVTVIYLNARRYDHYHVEVPNVVIGLNFIALTVPITMTVTWWRGRKYR